MNNLQFENFGISKSMSLLNIIWYRCKETGTDGVMLNNAICVHFNITTVCAIILLVI